MAKRMLIDAAHPEETRVVVLSGHRLDEFDFETSTKKQIKGNIYLAKVTRVEPSLQAAFVEYGGNRHGFLAFNEIHSDYYRIPVADRRRSLDTITATAARASRRCRTHCRATTTTTVGRAAGEITATHDDDAATGRAAARACTSRPMRRDGDIVYGSREPRTDRRWRGPSLGRGRVRRAPPMATRLSAITAIATSRHDVHDRCRDRASDGQSTRAPRAGRAQRRRKHASSNGDERGPARAQRRSRPSAATRSRRRQRHALASRMRHYKIQEVIKRRQIMLVQVTKEERGNKGAALTTYLSLAGRYCVLMPNTPRGGGVSRKITSADRPPRLKELLERARSAARAWASSSAPPAASAPRPRSSATSNI